MSETPQNSGWTLETLKVLMDERDRRYGEVQAAKEEGVRIAMLNAEKAVLVAERNAEKWRDNANEWRGAMTDRERTFLPKSMGFVIAALSGVAMLVSLLDKFAR